jgi:hypothetical protein
MTAFFYTTYRNNRHAAVFLMSKDERIRSLRDQCPNWIVYFVALINYLNRASKPHVKHPVLYVRIRTLHVQYRLSIVWFGFASQTIWQPFLILRNSPPDCYSRLHEQNMRPVQALFCIRGDERIRTSEGLHPTRFPSERTRPLCDVSVFYLIHYFLGCKPSGLSSYRRCSGCMIVSSVGRNYRQPLAEVSQTSSPYSLSKRAH